MNFEACNLLRARDLCVLDIAELEHAYSGPDFTRRDPGPHLELVHRLLGWFAERNTVEGGADGMLYDARPAAPGSPENQAFYGQYAAVERVRLPLTARGLQILVHF